MVLGLLVGLVEVERRLEVVVEHNRLADILVRKRLDILGCNLQVHACIVQLLDGMR